VPNPVYNIDYNIDRARFDSPQAFYVQAFAFPLFQIEAADLGDSALHKLAHFGFVKTSSLQQMYQRSPVKHLRVICSGVNQIIESVTERQALQESLGS